MDGMDVVKRYSRALQRCQDKEGWDCAIRISKALYLKRFTLMLYIGAGGLYIR